MQPGRVDIVRDISYCGTLGNGVIVSQRIGFKVLPEVASDNLLAVDEYNRSVIAQKAELYLQVRCGIILNREFAAEICDDIFGVFRSVVHGGFYQVCHLVVGIIS